MSGNSTQPINLIERITSFFINRLISRSSRVRCMDSSCRSEESTTRIVMFPDRTRGFIVRDAMSGPTIRGHRSAALSSSSRPCILVSWIARRSTSPILVISDLSIRWGYSCLLSLTCLSVELPTFISRKAPSLTSNRRGLP